MAFLAFVRRGSLLGTIFYVIFSLIDLLAFGRTWLFSPALLSFASWFIRPLFSAFTLGPGLWVVFFLDPNLPSNVQCVGWSRAHCPNQFVGSDGTVGADHPKSSTRRTVWSVRPRRPGLLVLCSK